MLDRWFNEIGDRLTKYLSFKNGIYIELGAFDGIRMSNTKWLEDQYGWTGILIEPSLNKFKECKKNRKDNKIFNCACVSFNDKEKTIKGDFNGTPMSSINGNRKNVKGDIIVNSRTLHSIIEESGYKKIDFLSLDVEGYELEVLKGIDFDTQKIEYILIEIYDKDKDDIFKFLDEKNYVFLVNISNFTKKTHPNWDGTHNDYLFKVK
jgi:FkbM family methyltransferase